VMMKHLSDKTTVQFQLHKSPTQIQLGFLIKPPPRFLKAESPVPLATGEAWSRSWKQRARSPKTDSFCCHHHEWTSLRLRSDHWRRTVWTKSVRLWLVELSSSSELEILWRDGPNLSQMN
jgi:hypothetical protein